MKKHTIIYGLISGAVVTTIMLAGMAGLFGNPCSEGIGGMIFGYTTMIVAFSLIFVSVKNYRDKQNGSFITFGKAFQIGLFITLIASTIYVVAWMVDYYCFIPDFFDHYSAHVIANMKASGATAQQIAAKTVEMRNQAIEYKKPYIIAIYTYLEIVPVGLLVSIVTALILKRTRVTDQLQTAS